MQNQESTKFEFLLSLEKNIIIQRFFNVNYHNPKSKNSMDLYECVKDICDEISDELKSKTLDFLNDNSNYFMENENAEDPSEIKDEYFKLDLKLGNDIFISRIFPGHVYHPKIRYSVDIRPKIRRMLSALSDVLSSNKLDTTYLQYKLS